MKQAIKQAADTVLDYCVNRAGGTPGVVAMATNRTANFYEGSAGKRALGGDQAMTLDSVMAIFSTTKAITGTTLMQLVEEGKVSLSDVAKNTCLKLRSCRYWTDLTRQASRKPAHPSVISP